MAAEPTAATAAPYPRADADAGAPDASRPRGAHRYDIDLIRVLASAGVILCHAAGQFMTAVGRAPSGGRAVYWTALGGDALSRCAVPLFFAIAGWVVLVGAPPRDGAQVRKRLARILVPMAVWTAAYLLWARARDTDEDPVRQLARDALFGSVRPAFHLWYLYAYVPVILVLSAAVLLRAGRRPWGVGAALLGLALAPTLLGDAARLLDFHAPRFAWQFGVYQIAYAVAGAVLLALPRSATAGSARRSAWFGCAVAAWAGVVWYEHRVHFPSPYASLLVALLAGALLVAIAHLRVPERIRPLLGRLAGVSFGAYLVHLMLLEALAPHLVSAQAGWLGAPARLTALWAATVALSFTAALLWTRLRLARWLG
ncbi:acyltransferase [Streptomyces sp. NPDC048182]|uniref:acyltransferase n=1 Tax=Streptomyces sp. NPDC048182 TaxID=3365507 RepID=UPI003722E7E0